MSGNVEEGSNKLSFQPCAWHIIRQLCREHLMIGPDLYSNNRFIVSKAKDLVI